MHSFIDPSLFESTSILDGKDTSDIALHSGAGPVLPQQVQLANSYTPPCLLLDDDGGVGSSQEDQLALGLVGPPGFLDDHNGLLLLPQVVQLFLHSQVALGSLQVEVVGLHDFWVSQNRLVLLDFLQTLWVANPPVLQIVFLVKFISVEEGVSFEEVLHLVVRVPLVSETGGQLY